MVLSHLLLSEAEFLAEVAGSTSAVAVDCDTEKILYATVEAEKVFGCLVKNGLNGMQFEELIPPEFREVHRQHFREYLKNPKPRAMGDSMMRLRAYRPIDGSSFPVAVTLLPVNKYERLYVIVRIMPLPTKDS